MVLLHSTRGFCVQAGRQGRRARSRTLVDAAAPDRPSELRARRVGVVEHLYRHELGLRLCNVTERGHVVELRSDCSRWLQDSLRALFSSRTFSPSAWNTLIASSCNATASATRAAATNCSILPGNYLDNSSCCMGPDADSIRCVPPPSPPHSFAHRF
jgi:hypothetical protein